MSTKYGCRFTTKRIRSAIDDLPLVDSDVSHAASFSQIDSEISQLKHQVMNQMTETQRLHREQITGLEKQMAEQMNRLNEQMDMFRQYLGLDEDKDQSIGREGRGSA